MKIVEFKDRSNQICDINCELTKDKFTIRWRWPENIDIVYILKINSLEDFSLDNISENNVKLYTREEYKEFNGYCENIKEINQYRYYVFPALQSEEDILLVKQHNGKNEIIVSTGKVEISYKIKVIKSLKKIFSKEKTIQIIIESEVQLHKDALCYVKKRASYPISNEDGIRFDFIDDIHSGINVMPEITVNKDEYIKVFIKDIDKYGGSYHLKQE